MLNEIIRICIGEKVGKWLKKQMPKMINGHFYYNDIDKIVGNVPPSLSKYFFTQDIHWLPISYDLKHNCLQIEALLMKKLGIKTIGVFKEKFSERDRDDSSILGGNGNCDKSYIVQCLLWLQELIEKEGE